MMSEKDLYGIVKKPAFEVIIAREKVTTTENGQNQIDLPAMKDAFGWSDDYFTLTELVPEGGPVTGAKTLGIVTGELGVPEFTYAIAVEKTEAEMPAGFSTMRIPEATWAVFYDDTWWILGTIYNYIFDEWFPATGHQLDVNTPIMEVYCHEEAGPYFQIWVPIAGEVDEIPLVPNQEDWGKSSGYPSGTGYERKLRVGNFSGGFESLYPDRVRTIQAPAQASPLSECHRDDLKYSWGSTTKTVSDYMKTWPVTGLIIARDGEIWVEEYELDRKPDMRFSSWSMAKSVTSLLLGICLDRGMIKSLNDSAENYVSSLKGTLHGGVSLRDLSNMSSGAAILHDRDNRAVIYPDGFWKPDSDLESIVRNWNTSQEPPGARFNYNELCAFTIGMAIREVTGMGLAQFCQEALWQPMGAEADAVWLTDSKGKEFNCVYFSARLRDWVRLGQLVAQNGEMNGNRIVSKEWIDECSSWSVKDKQVRHGNALPGIGYKTFFWHPRKDGSLMLMSGAFGQVTMIDRNTRTVLVKTAVDEQSVWMRELVQLFRVATQLE